MRILSLLFGALALGLAGVAAWPVLFPAPVEPPEPDDAPDALSVEAGDADLGKRPLGDVRFSVRLRNGPAHPIRVVGVSFCCGNGACVAADEGFASFDIPAGGEARLAVEAKHGGEAGRFDCPLVVNFLQRGAYRQVSVAVTGTWDKPAVPGGGLPDAKKMP